MIDDMARRPLYGGNLHLEGASSARVLQDSPGDSLLITRIRQIHLIWLQILEFCCHESL